MFDLMQYALIFDDFQLILAQMPPTPYLLITTYSRYPQVAITLVYRQLAI